MLLCGCEALCIATMYENYYKTKTDLTCLDTVFKSFISYSPNEKPGDEEWLLEAAAALAAALELCSRIPDRTLALSICEHTGTGETTT